MEQNTWEYIKSTLSRRIEMWNDIDKAFETPIDKSKVRTKKI